MASSCAHLPYKIRKNNNSFRDVCKRKFDLMQNSKEIHHALVLHRLVRQRFRCAHRALLHRRQIAIVTFHIHVVTYLQTSVFEC